MSIRDRRLDRGWSQEELARHSGITTRTIQRIEGGRRAGLESLKSRAAVFETSVSTLEQEQTMGETPTNENTGGGPMLLQIEREAIEFAQSIVNGPKPGKRDPITPLERNAIEFAKRLLGKFNSGN